MTERKFWYEVRNNSASPKGNARNYSRHYRHIALVVTDSEDEVAIRDTKHTRVIRHIKCVCVGTTNNSWGYRMLKKYQRLAARGNRLLEYRRGTGVNNDQQ